MEVEFKGKKYDLESDCPIRILLNRLGNKWSLSVLLSLGAKGTMRFNEIHKLVGDISQRMLSVTLRKLEADGVISCMTYPEVPPRTEYTITKSGERLLLLLVDLSDWVIENLKVSKPGKN